MNSIDLRDMRSYLEKSISSINANKLRGLLAEVEFRQHLTDLGFAERVSPGGWIMRSEGPSTFAHSTFVMFPQTVLPGKQYSPDRELPQPDHGLHTICSTFHQIGLKSFFCAPMVYKEKNPQSVDWAVVELGLPKQQPFITLADAVKGLRPRERRYNFLRYHTDISTVPDQFVPEEFSKEHLRVSISSNYLTEISDVDGIFWGEQYTYPIEIKEKTPATDNRTGDYFGLDVGPFVKLAYYAAKKGNLHSLFVVREIDDVSARNLVCWWAITFERLAQFASWVPVAGGVSMGGGRSSVIKIPKAEFAVLDKEYLKAL